MKYTDYNCWILNVRFKVLNAIIFFANIAISAGGEIYSRIRLLLPRAIDHSSRLSSDFNRKKLYGIGLTIPFSPFNYEIVQFAITDYTYECRWFFFILPLFHFEQLYQLMGNFLNTIQCNLSFRIEFCRFCRNFFPSMRVSLFLLCLCHCTLFLSSIFSL